MPSRFRQVNEVCLRRRKSRYTPGAKPPVHPLKKETPAAHGSCLRPTKITPAALNALRRAILLPRAVEPMAPRLHPTFSEGFSQWRTFVPAALPLRCILAPTVPFAWGSFAPFLSGWHLAVFRPLRYPPHSILGHDSLSGPVSPQSHSYHTRFPRKSQRPSPCKTALYCRTAKNRRSGAESPCFAGKKDV